MNKISLLLKKPSLWMLGAFMLFVRPLLGPKGVCRFSPTCSEYARQAVAKHGAFKGAWLAVRRVLKCHPFHPGGYDPVP